MKEIRCVRIQKDQQMKYKRKNTNTMQMYIKEIKTIVYNANKKICNNGEGIKTNNELNNITYVRDQELKIKKSETPDEHNNE